MWLDDFINYSQQSLGDRELEALWARGVSEDQIREFRIGYVSTLPAEFRKVKEFYQEWWARGRFTDVFVFPLTNALGQVKGLQVRRVDREAKGYSDWLASKDEPVFFGLAQATETIWKTKRVVLVEGVYDLFPVQRVFPETVATLTAKVSSGFERFLKRMVDQVWFCYDMDGPGIRGVKDFADTHLQDFTRVMTASKFPQVKLVTGKYAKDPSDAWEALGDERFGVVLKAAFAEIPRRYVNG